MPLLSPYLMAIFTWRFFFFFSNTHISSVAVCHTHLKHLLSLARSLARVQFSVWIQNNLSTFETDHFHRGNWTNIRTGWIKCSVSSAFPFEKPWAFVNGCFGFSNAKSMMKKHTHHTQQRDIQQFRCLCFISIAFQFTSLLFMLSLSLSCLNISYHWMRTL